MRKRLDEWKTKGSIRGKPVLGVQGEAVLDLELDQLGVPVLHLTIEIVTCTYKKIKAYLRALDTGSVSESPDDDPLEARDELELVLMDQERLLSVLDEQASDQNERIEAIKLARSKLKKSGKSTTASDASLRRAKETRKDIRKERLEIAEEIDEGREVLAAIEASLDEGANHLEDVFREALRSVGADPHTYFGGEGAFTGREGLVFTENWEAVSGALESQMPPSQATAFRQEFDEFVQVGNRLGKLLITAGGLNAGERTQMVLDGKRWVELAHVEGKTGIPPKHHFLKNHLSGQLLLGELSEQAGEGIHAVIKRRAATVRRIRNSTKRAIARWKGLAAWQTPSAVKIESEVTAPRAFTDPEGRKKAKEARGAKRMADRVANASANAKRSKGST